MLAKYIRSSAYVLVCAAALTACGGGGNDSNSNGNGSTTSPVSPASAALTFNPAVATATLEAGKSSTITVGASVNRPGDFTGNVFAMVVDSTGVLLPNARISSQSPTQYSAVLQTSPSLAAGSYKGNFTVNVCRDQGCSQHYPGSPMQLPYDFTVKAGTPKLVAQAAGSLNQSVKLGGTATPVTVNVQGMQLNWTASTTAPWLILKNASGTGNGSFTVEYDSRKASEGSQYANILVSASDGQQYLLTASLSVTASSFSVSQSSAMFTAVNGAPIDPQQIKLTMDGGGNWSSVSSASWLSATPSNGSFPGEIALKVNPAIGKLASGVHSGTLTLSSPDSKDRSIAVSLNLSKPVLNVSADNVTLGGTYGRDFTAKALTMHLNTMKNSWPWAFGNLPAWLNASARNGQVNQDGTSVQLSANLASTPIGSNTVVVDTTVQVNGDTVTKPITFTINRDQQKILPSETGLAMVSVPGWSRLTRTITVRDNFGANTDWSATSNQSWLRVARSGNQLTLTGDPASLPNDAVSYATVTLSTSAVGVRAPEVVRVALWKGSQTPAAKTEFKTAYSTMIADAIRPLVYVHKGGSTIDVYNVYTGQQVATSAALGGALGEMTMSQNGDRLYVYDTANRNVLVVNPQTLAKQDTWNLRNAADTYSTLISVRPNGEELVLTSVGDAFRVADGLRIPVSLYGAMAATRDGRRLYSQNSGYSPSSASAYDLDYSAIGGGSLHLAAVGGFSGGSNGQDIAASLDGKRFYTANGAPYRCAVADASNMSQIGSLPGGDAYPNNVEVDSFGRVYCGISGWYSKADVWLHDSNGAELKQFKFAGYARNLQPRQMAVSADGMMLIGLTDDPIMAIMVVGP